MMRSGRLGPPAEMNSNYDGSTNSTTRVSFKNTHDLKFKYFQFCDSPTTNSDHAKCDHIQKGAKLHTI